MTLAYKGAGAAAGKVFLIIPFQASNATRARQELNIERADLSEGSNVFGQAQPPAPLDLLPAAHGKRELYWEVDANLKPTKIIVQPQPGAALRLTLPKGWTITPPSTTGKVGDSVSHGLVRLKLGPFQSSATNDESEAEEGKHFLTAEWTLTNEMPMESEVSVSRFQLVSGEGETVDPASEMPVFNARPGGSKTGKVIYQVPKTFVPAKVEFVGGNSEQVITILLK